jgi:hypothetical protein
MDSRGSFDQDKAFLLGLLDCCPRCGETFDNFPDQDQRLHLMECTDDNGKQAAYKKKLEKAKEVAEKKEKKLDAQDDAQTVAAWQFLGAKTDQLWLLNEEQLRHQALDSGLDIEGDKDDLISRIAENKRQAEDSTGKAKKMKLLGNSSSASSSSSSNKDSNAIVLSKKVKLSADSLPSNMHTMSAPQLRSVCAANGLLHLIDKNASKSDILEMIENELYNEKGEKGEKGGKDDGSSSKWGKKRVLESEDDASEASDDGGSDRD